MKLQAESTVSLEKWYIFEFKLVIALIRDTADNIDLYMILSEYEEFFELKYSRPPKLVKKLAENSSMLPKIHSAIKKGNSFVGVNNEKNEKHDKNEKKPPISKPNSKSDSKTEPNSSTTNNTNIEITGNSINIANPAKKKAEEEDFFENRVLKAIPQDLIDIPDLRELAQYLQRDICIDNPNVKFTDIMGLDQAKALLKEAVLLPLKYPQFFVGLLEPWKGVLLFGPPGTGKVFDN